MPMYQALFICSYQYLKAIHQASICYQLIAKGAIYITFMKTTGYDHSNSTMQSNLKPSIPPEVSKKLVATFPPKDGKSTTKRVSPETATAISEALRLFLVDAHHRASIEAECDEECDLNGESTETLPDDVKYTISANHVTRVAGELLMDFS